MLVVGHYFWYTEVTKSGVIPSAGRKTDEEKRRWRSGGDERDSETGASGSKEREKLFDGRDSVAGGKC